MVEVERSVKQVQPDAQHAGVCGRVGIVSAHMHMHVHGEISCQRFWRTCVWRPSGSSEDKAFITNMLNKKLTNVTAGPS